MDTPHHFGFYRPTTPAGHNPRFDESLQTRTLCDVCGAPPSDTGPCPPEAVAAVKARREARLRSQTRLHVERHLAGLQRAQ